VLAIRSSFVVLAATVVMAAGSDTTTDPSSEVSSGEEGRILFQRAPCREVTEAEATNVHIVSADGSESDVESLYTDAESGRWSPDGSEVSVFCCGDPGAVAHFVDVNTGEVRTLATPDPTLELHCEFGWSPDGERVVCEGYGIDDPSGNGIYTVRAHDGGDLTRITSNPDGGDIPSDYSPDGTQLVFKRFEGEVMTGVFVVDIADDGTAAGDPQRLTPEGMVLDDTRARWSLVAGRRTARRSCSWPWRAKATTRRSGS
jgi:Tol biopolymer transport system component